MDRTITRDRNDVEVEENEEVIGDLHSDRIAVDSIQAVSIQEPTLIKEI